MHDELNAHRAHADARLALAEADVDTLLTKAYHLTHKMHASQPEHREDIRAQRDLITAEIKRRCDDERDD